MKIIILEGIATSGKTSVRKELEKLLNNKNLKTVFVDEDETIMPLLHNTDPKIGATHVVDILKKYTTIEADILIFDRLYITHIWRTKSDLEIFKEATDILLKYNSLICLLTISEERISDRIEQAMTHRDKWWNAYVKTKGSTKEERETYYVNQQKELRDILERIDVGHKVFDTEEMNFVGIAKEIHSLI